MNLDIQKITEGYAQNIDTAMIIAGVVIVIALYLLRNPLKALFAGFAGYRAGVDDFSVAIHKNRDVVFENEKKFYTLDKKAMISSIPLFFSVPLLLVHPAAAATSFLVFVSYHTLKKAKEMNSYHIYRDIKGADGVIRVLNSYRDHVNIITNMLILASIALIALGIYAGNIPVTIAGVGVGVLVSIAAIFTIYDIAMYRVNYQPIEYYRALRLLNATALGRSRGIVPYVALSVASNFYLPGAGLYVWILTGLKAFTTLTVNLLLFRDDEVAREHSRIENREYNRIERISSYPNPISQGRGYRVATPLQMKFFQLEKERAGDDRLIHIDNYAFYPQAVNRSDLRKNPLLRKKIEESVKIKFDVLDFTKQLVVIGGMGSGKTEMINNIVAQVHDSGFNKFKSIIFNDIKGDFTRKFYRPERDYIVNLFDSRAAVWDIFAEMEHNIEAGTNFISNLFEAIAGKEKDFFNARAKQLMSQWTQESFFESESSKDAWKLLFEKIDAYKEAVGEDKTRSSIYQTIEIAVGILSIMKYQIVEEGRRTFSIAEFLNDADRQLFLVNNPQYAEKLMPYLTGIWGAITSSVMAKPDNKDHLILNVIDEFLSLDFNESTRTTLLTAVRSKGMANILAMQYLKKDEKIIQQLDSSRYALITFNINDDFTLENVVKKFAKAEILTSQFTLTKSDEHRGHGSENSNPVLNFPNVAALGLQVANRKRESESMMSSLAEKEVLLKQQLQSMPKYHHLTFIPSEEVKIVDDEKRYFKLFSFDYDELMLQIAENDEFLAKESGIIYLGYTSLVEIGDNNSNFEKWDMTSFYRARARREEEKKAELDEFERFKHYMNIKFAGSVEAAAEYIYEHGLDEYDIDILFRAVEENPEKVERIVEEKGEEERFDLMQQFFEIGKNDYRAQYDFCKEHDLIGAILGAFVFTEVFTKALVETVEGGE